MKSFNIILSILGLFVLGGAAYYVTTGETPKASSIVATQVLAQNANFTYQTFDNESFNNLKGNEAFAVFVHSKTCGTCAKKEKQIMEEITQFNNGTILKMDWDSAPTEFLKNYEVNKYDTFVVFDAEGNHQTIKGAKVEEVRTSVQ